MPLSLAYCRIKALFFLPVMSVLISCEKAAVISEIDRNQHREEKLFYDVKIFKTLFFLK